MCDKFMPIRILIFALQVLYEPRVPFLKFCQNTEPNNSFAFSRPLFIFCEVKLENMGYVLDDQIIYVWSVNLVRASRTCHCNFHLSSEKVRNRHTVEQK
jgi:hypothetical protein